MPRFADNWVLDKCMFDYVQGGSCACCGFPHLFAPGGLEGMINAMSDLETDTATNEINAAKASPWPPDMRDQIWSDRLLLRFRMKKDMKVYRAFLEGVVKGDDMDKEEVDVKDSIAPLHQFCINDLSPTQLRQIFQLPRSELTEVLKSKYKICSAYAVVFCTVAEQLANFKVTGYGVDARSSSGDDNSEEIFEKELKFEKIGPGFCLNIATNHGVGGSHDWKVNDEVLLKFLQRMVSLAGPTLLARAAKTSHDNDGSDSDKDGSETSEKNDSNIPSFRSDRRVIRLMIARYWADRLMEKYNEVQKKKGEQTIENSKVVT
mmetsp:Transcript_28228/g.60152  ORF Transcript_28228/g.60152 Transcript_28228/m.60152 type:complete len:319 (-) Transcript_28228:12-968(-)